MDSDRPNPIGLRLDSAEKALWQKTQKENGFRTLTKFIKACVEYVIRHPEVLMPDQQFNPKVIPLERLERKLDLLIKAQNIPMGSENSGVFD